MTTKTGFIWLREFSYKQESSLWTEMGNVDEKVFCEFIQSIFFVVFFLLQCFTFLLWPIAIYKDVLHSKNDLSAAFASLFCVTPAYVIFMIPWSILGAAISLIMTPIFFIYGILKLVAICLSCICIAATRKVDDNH